MDLATCREVNGPILLSRAGKPEEFQEEPVQLCGCPVIWRKMWQGLQAVSGKVFACFDQNVPMWLWFSFCQVSTVVSGSVSHLTLLSKTKKGKTCTWCDTASWWGLKRSPRNMPQESWRFQLVMQCEVIPKRFGTNNAQVPELLYKSSLHSWKQKQVSFINFSICDVLMSHTQCLVCQSRNKSEAHVISQIRSE